jgi:RpiB/LacA/LacB family sugar-phosphate isomerase
MKVYIGADHRGFELKEKITKWLFEWGYQYIDVGAQILDPSDDYTKFAAEVASMIGRSASAKATADKGILLCGSGVGADVAANKFDGVRASVGIDAKQVKEGREDDDMNVLVIAADHTSEDLAKEMIKAFLETKFDEKARHKRRLEDIKKIEANN